MNTRINDLIDNIEKVIVGKREIIELVVTAMIARGHVLIEDVPGVGKTQMVASLANSCRGKFNRLQLTPDVMPSDITGFSMLNQNTRELEFRQGAAFCNFLLADEINRSSPKTQSALLEVMEEEQVSIDGKTYELPKPFMVLATQNPVETYGTYHLPEAQMDRFIMKLSVGYPSAEDELMILKRDRLCAPDKLEGVVSMDDIMELSKNADEVICSDAIEKYIVEIANVSRHNEGIRLGVSPRGTVALRRAVKAYALVKGRDHVLPDDVKYVAPFVLAHRIMLTPKGKSMWEYPEAAIRSILNNVTVV